VRSLNLSPYWRWALALVLSLAGLFAQRLLSSELPLVVLLGEEGRPVTTELARVHVGPGGQRLSVQGVEADWTGVLIWRPSGGEGDFTRTPLRNLGSLITGEIPAHTRGARVEYRLELETPGGLLRLPEHGTVVTRFRGAAPFWVSLSHIVLIALALLLAMRAGLEALALGEHALGFAVGALLTFLSGGLIVGPLMKHHAYGLLWTGPPIGLDSTDTKTLIVAIAWLLPLLLRARGRRVRRWIILAALLSLAAFLIPHSTFGPA
jgi:hypothetical protein